jgi:addiction module RelE/StbE family toxin
MSFQIGTTPRFKRRLKKFSRAHPELRQTFAELLRELQEDPFQPKLRLHKLSGNLGSFLAVSLTHSYHVILPLMVDEQKIILVDIGSHDEIYR